MNAWVSDAFEYPTRPLDRGKVLSAEQLEALGNVWGRYKDVDGDGIPYRTLPGNPNRAAAYFTRGTGHNEMAAYTERSDDWERNLNRLGRKFDTARDLVPAPIVQESPGATVAILSLGSWLSLRLLRSNPQSKHCVWALRTISLSRFRWMRFAPLWKRRWTT